MKPFCCRGDVYFMDGTIKRPVSTDNVFLYVQCQEMKAQDPFIADDELKYMSKSFL